MTRQSQGVQRSHEATRARLVNLDDPSEVWELSGDELTLGARRDNDLVLRAAGVSRLHALLIREGDGWTIEDAGSRHGIRVNGERTEQHALASGDVLTFGAVSLGFEAPRAETPEDSSLGSSLASTWSRVTWPEALGFVEPKRRPALLVAAGAAVALLVMSALGGGDHNTARASTARPGASAHASLVAGHYGQASKEFRRQGLRAADSGARKRARAFERIATVWSAKAKGPEAFRWDRARELLRSARVFKDLPTETVAWLEAEGAWVESGREAYQALEAARGLAVSARAQLEQKDREGSVRILEEALARLQGATREGPLGPEVEAQVAALRAELSGTLVRFAQDAMGGDRPDYEAALAFLERARPYADDAQARTELRSLVETCRLNREDERRCAAAVAHLTSRDVERYDEALALLAQVDPRSSIHTEAQAWAAWADADRKTRRAELLYAQGHAEDALRLLEEAGAADIDRNARQALTERQERWSQVVQAYTRGRDMSRAGHAEQAIREFETVLALEPDRANRFRRMAGEMLADMQRSDRATQHLTLRRGLEALERGDYSAAHRAFETIRRDPGRRNEDGAAIARAVREANAERGLVARSRRTLHVDAVERFEELRDVLTLLKRWLHRADPEREDAIRFLEVVNRRLKTQAMSGGQRS